MDPDFGFIEQLWAFLGSMTNNTCSLSLDYGCFMQSNQPLHFRCTEIEK